MIITSIFRPIVELDPFTRAPISPCSFTEYKEENLLKMGIFNPEEFYYTDRKTADLTLRLFEIFKSHSLHLIYETEKKEIIAYDSTFLDMDMIYKDIFRKYNLSPFRRNFPEFHMQNQTFCAQIDALTILLKLKTPDLRSWASLLNKSPKTISESDLTIQLPSGKFYSQESFVENSIFKYTLEKYNVFRFLPSFIKKNDFPIQYPNFLENIKKENWTSYYIENPGSLAYLSLVAFLDDQIKSEDLYKGER